MDIDTTSINELPIMSNNPSSSNNEQMEQMQQTTQNIVIDRDSLPDVREPKQVRFNDTPIVQQDSQGEPEISQKPNVMSYELGIQAKKICILAALIFFLLMDPKIKKYILNILVQVFGSFLKTEHGNMTQLGILVYAVFYFSVLQLLITKSIDISSFHLAV